MTRRKMGSVTYHGYDSLSEAFLELPEQAQAIYMTLLAGRQSAQGEPVVLIDLAAFGEALDCSAMDVYKTLSYMTGVVVSSDVRLSGDFAVPMLRNGKVMTCLAISVQEVFDGEGTPVSVTIVLPFVDGHDALMQQFEDLSLSVEEGK